MHIRTILVAILVSVAALYISPAYGQVATPSTPQLGMGFSAGTVLPVAQGIPIYTIGDQLWVMSYSQTPITVVLSAPGNVIIARKSLQPMTSSLFYSFSSEDVRGLWNLTVSAVSTFQSGVKSVRFLFIKGSVIPANMTSYSLGTNGALAMDFTINANDSYDISSCLFGPSLQGAVSVPVPTSLGSGQLLLKRNGSQVLLTPEAQIANPFTFWIELYHDYSYTVNGVSSLVSKSIEVAESTAVPVTTNESNSTNVTLQNDLHLRTGRFTLREFFESASGLSVHQNQVLIPDNSTWLSLDGCTSTSTSLGSSFSLSTSLQQPASDWPRGLYVMYKEEGVETFSETPLEIMPAVVKVSAFPWGENLTDSQIAVVPGPAIDRFVLDNATIYLMAKEYPAQLSVAFSGGEEQSLQIDQPFSINDLNVNSSKLDVGTLLNGKALSGAAVSLRSGNATVARASARNGATTFYLPQGNYTVEAMFGNSTQVDSVVAQAGRESNVTFDFVATTNAPSSYLLIGTGIVGIAASLWVWIRVYRRRFPS